MTTSPLPAGPSTTSSPTSQGPLALTSDALKQLPMDAALELMRLEELKRKKQKWVSDFESAFQKCKAARAPFERQWYLNLAFTSGKQYIAPIDVPSQGFRLVSPKAPPWRVRIVVNKIRMAVRTECAKLTTSKPIPTVRPATNEGEDFSAAAIGEQLVKTEFANATFEGEYRSWIWWGVVCGNSFMKQWYDPSELDYESKSLPPAPAFPDGTPIPDNLLEQIPGLKEAVNTPRPAVGKVMRERITPFHIYVPDLLSEKIDDQPYVIHTMTKSPLWVEQKYGVKCAPDSRASHTILDAATLITKGQAEHLDACLVKEVWIKPNGHKDFPEGGMLTIVGNEVVACQEKWPYPFPEYPFYKYNGIPTGGFYSDSTVVDLIPIQKEYNKKRSQAIEIQNMMGKPKFIYQKGSVQVKKISSEPGQGIEYTAGYEKPEVIPGAEIPTSFITELQTLAGEFDDISGQHEISRGQTQISGLTSGTAIAYLQEQDDAKLNYQVASVENACELMGRHYLSLIGTYWKEDRLIRTTGRNKAYETLHWKRGVLRGNTDVKVQTGSALPYSKAATQAFLTEMMQNGFIDPQMGLEMMNFGNLDSVLDEALIDKRQAIRENLKMSDFPDGLLSKLLEPAPGPNGEAPFEQPNPMNGGVQKFNGDGTPFQPQPPLPVNSWDNHAAHIQEHNNFRKTQEYELLSPVKKQAFEMHVQLHQMAGQSQLVNHEGMPVQDNSGMGMQPPQAGGVAPEGNAQPPNTSGPPGPPPDVSQGI